VFARYLVLAGTLRFLIEFIRINARVLGPFTIAQIFSTAVVVTGLSLMFGNRQK
jgi:prolipoprotein diacylglyceryltransferase